MGIKIRNLGPFFLGFACALLLVRFKFSLLHLNDLSELEYETERAVRSLDCAKCGSLPRRSPPRKKVVAVIGVQTGFTAEYKNKKYDYSKRREALRKTWFPPSQAALDELEVRSGIVMRFVIGHSTDSKAEGELAAEEESHGAFLRLPIEESYRSLTNKTLTFFRTVVERYEAQYIIKVDDDVYLRVDRIPSAAIQWEKAKADYIGCMKTGPIYSTPNYKWYEPQHAVLGSKSYFTHCWGSVYVLSGRAADALAAINPLSLRFFANEDVTIGSWMLALRMQHFDDRRLCSTECNTVSLAVFDYPNCAGLCEPVQRLKELHESKECHSPATQSDGKVPLLPPIIDFFPIAL